MGFTASFRALLCGALATLPIVHAHGHHELAPIKPGEHQKPIDSILWIHMLLQAVIWGVVFPTGMVLGLSKSRWHVPLQSAALVLTVGGIFLGHAHGGRQFPASAHGRLGELIFFPIVTQAVLGIYLKLHIHEKTLRPYAVVAHGIVGKSYPIWGWVQMLFGGIVLRGYCVGGNINQCLAHYIMGSGFIGYGTIMAIMFVAGESWIRRHGRSPEFYDSAVITVWGLVNTFTEHLGGEWSVKDMQHTVMGGILWFTGGVLGLLLSRKNQRSLVPSIIIILTGWAMSNHEQALMISTAVHSMFGYTLMLAGLARIIEIIAFVPTYASPETAPSGDSASEHTLSGEGIMSGKENLRELGGKSFRHLPPFLMVASGLLFMSATDEELRATHDAGMDHVTYILIFYSLAFVVYTIIIGLITLYLNSGRNAVSATDAPGVELRETGGAKWYAPVPGSAREVASEHHIVGDDD